MLFFPISHASFHLDYRILFYLPFSAALLHSIEVSLDCVSVVSPWEDVWNIVFSEIVLIALLCKNFRGSSQCLFIACTELNSVNSQSSSWFADLANIKS